MGCCHSDDAEEPLNQNIVSNYTENTGTMNASQQTETSISENEETELSHPYQSKLMPNPVNYRQWNYIDIACWITTMDDGNFDKYEEVFNT